MLMFAMLVTLILLAQADRETAKRKVTLVLARTGLTCSDLVWKEREQEREQAKTALKKAVTFKENVIGLTNHLVEEAAAQSNHLVKKVLANKEDPALSAYGVIRLGEIKQAIEAEMTKVDMVLAASSTAAVWTAGALFNKTVHTACMLNEVGNGAPNNKAIVDNLDSLQAPENIQLSDKYEAISSNMALNFDKSEATQWEAFEQFLGSDVVPDLAKQTEADIVIGVVVGSAMFKFAGCATRGDRVSAGQVSKLDFTWEPESPPANARDQSPTNKFLWKRAACTEMAGSGTSIHGDFCEADLGVCKGMMKATDTTFNKLVEEWMPYAQQKLRKATEAAKEAADAAAKAKQDPELAAKELTDSEMLEASAEDEAGSSQEAPTPGLGKRLADGKAKMLEISKKFKTGTAALTKHVLSKSDHTKGFAIRYLGTLDEQAEAANHELEKVSKDFDELQGSATEERKRLSTVTCKNGQQPILPLWLFPAAKFSSVF